MASEINSTVEVIEEECEALAEHSGENPGKDSDSSHSSEAGENFDPLELDEDSLARLAESDQPPVDLLAAGLGAAGGGWGGAQHPVDRAWAIGRAGGLGMTSRKRSSGSSGSDHHTSQRRSDAVDMSNGGAPTPQMDRVARQIAALLGYSNWQGGILNWRGNGYRVQLLYRTNVGGNHYNHVHVGVRVGG